MSKSIALELPWLRLVIYVIIAGVCGAVTGREIFYFLASHGTTATVVSVGKYASRGRTSGFWGQYEYADTQGNLHLGKADSFTYSLDGAMSPTAVPGDQVDVQFLRHAPQTSRLTPSPVGGLCFGAVALFAAFVFAAEVVASQRRMSGQRPGPPVED